MNNKPALKYRANASKFAVAVFYEVVNSYHLKKMYSESQEYLNKFSQKSIGWQRLRSQEG